MELPLGATEDRICGTINIEKALQEGVKAYEPGLLVRGIYSPIICTTLSFPASWHHYLDLPYSESEL